MGQDTLLLQGMADETDTELAATVIGFAVTGEEAVWLDIVHRRLEESDILWECEAVTREMYDTPFRGMTLDGHSFSVAEGDVAALKFILKMAHWPHMVVHVGHE